MIGSSFVCALLMIGGDQERRPVTRDELIRSEMWEIFQLMELRRTNLKLLNYEPITTKNPPSWMTDFKQLDSLLQAKGNSSRSSQAIVVSSLHRPWSYQTDASLNKTPVEKLTFRNRVLFAENKDGRVIMELFWPATFKTPSGKGRGNL